ncbi:MAG: TolC family protein [Phycisphaerae bacterium]
MVPASRILAAVCFAALLTGGCGPKWQSADADREVYRIVAKKSDEALGEPASKFTIEPDREVQALFEEAAKDAESVSTVPEDAEGAELPPPLPEEGPNTIVLTAADALRLAVRTSREYQSQKEDVYLAALGLTFQRYLFRPHPFATGTVNLNNDTGARDRTYDGSADVGISQQLADGATIVGSLGLTVLKFLNKDLANTLDSTFSWTLTQPLWRGAGRAVVQENLVQSERNALYAVRTFARYEQTFAVSIASQYLRVLQQREVVLNEWRNYRSLIQGRERSESLAQADRLAQFQVDQARQDELRARDRWIRAREAYANALDDFKIVLGIPVAAPVALEPKELERLTSEGLKPVEMDPAGAVATALERRLDLANTRDGVDDAQRKIVVAEDGLEGDVDLVASIGYASDPLRSQQSARLAFHKGDYSIGFDIDMPVDRLQERNALRETQIEREQAQRALARLRDDVILQVRQAYRQLEQSRQSYEIQNRSVELAQRRVESTDLLLQAGRASQRDVLESQQALLDAQNALAQALVDHTIAGLALERDIGTLVVDLEGQIHGWNLTPVGR